MNLRRKKHKNVGRKAAVRPTKLKLRQQKKIGEATIQLQQREEKWYLKLEASTYNNSPYETFNFIKSCRKSRRSGPIPKPEISEPEGVSSQIAPKIGDMATNLELAKDEARLKRSYGGVQGHTKVVYANVAWGSSSDNEQQTETLGHAETLGHEAAISGQE